MELGSNRPPSNEGHGFEAIYQGTSQKVAYTGTMEQSTALGARTSVVRLVSTSNAHVKIGLTSDNSAAGPTAVADGTCTYLPLGVPLMIGVPSGGKAQIAVIQDSAAGNLFITEGL